MTSQAFEITITITIEIETLRAWEQFNRLLLPSRRHRRVFPCTLDICCQIRSYIPHARRCAHSQTLCVCVSRAIYQNSHIITPEEILSCCIYGPMSPTRVNVNISSIVMVVTSPRLLNPNVTNAGPRGALA